MFKFIIGFFIFLGSLLAENPYGIKWQKSFNSGGSDTAAGLVYDSDGFYYIAGTTTGNMPGFTNAGETDGFIIKTDENGTLIWVYQLGTSSHERFESIEIDTNGDIVIGGFISDGNISATPSNGGSDSFIAKVTKDGILSWITQFGTNKDDSASYVALDNQNNVYATGFTSGDFPTFTSTYQFEIFVAKFDSSGTQVWLDQTGTDEGDIARGICVAPNGTLFVTGETEGLFTDETTIINDDTILLKYDTSTGNQIFAHQIPANGRSFGRDIVCDTNNNIFITGNVYGNYDGFDYNNTNGSSDGFIIKFLNDGTQSWIDQFGTSYYDGSFTVSIDQSNNVIVTGETQGELTTPKGNGSKNIFLRKYSNSGTKIWTKQYGMYYVQTPYATTVNDSFELAVTGWYRTLENQNIDFSEDVFLDMLSVNSNPKIINKPYNYTVSKISSNGLEVGVIEAEDEDIDDVLTFQIDSGNALNTFEINATSGSIKVKDNTTIDSDFNLTVSVSDIVGNSDTTYVYLEIPFGELSFEQQIQKAICPDYFAEMNASIYLELNSSFKEGNVSGYYTGYSEGNTTGYIDGNTSGFTYGFIDGNSTGYSSGYSEGNTTGYIQGHSIGYSAGDLDGYDRGYFEGNNTGYQKGYDNGTSETMDYCNQNPELCGIKSKTVVIPLL